MFRFARDDDDDVHSKYHHFFFVLSLLSVFGLVRLCSLCVCVCVCLSIQHHQIYIKMETHTRMESLAGERAHNKWHETLLRKRT